jgi:hypothetical protein
VPRIITASAILLGAAGVGLTCYGLAIRAEAEALLKDITALEVGRSTEEEARHFSERHKRSFDYRGCQGGSCLTTFKVANRWLSALRVEPEALFTVDLETQNGVVKYIDAKLARSMPIYPTFGASAGIVEEYAEIPQDMGSRGHYSFPTPVGKPYLRILLDSQASATQRQHAFAFSFRCLIKPGWGCDLPCDYLPVAWQDWRAEVHDSGFLMSDFNRSYPNNVRCTP